MLKTDRTAQVTSKLGLFLPFFPKIRWTHSHWINTGTQLALSQVWLKCVSPGQTQQTALPGAVQASEKPQLLLANRT